MGCKPYRLWIGDARNRLLVISSELPCVSPQTKRSVDWRFLAIDKIDPLFAAFFLWMACRNPVLCCLQTTLSLFVFQVGWFPGHSLVLNKIQPVGKV